MNADYPNYQKAINIQKYDFRWLRHEAKTDSKVLYSVGSIQTNYLLLFGAFLWIKGRVLDQKKKALQMMAGSTNWRRVFKYGQWALADVAQCIEHLPVNPKVTGLIPSQGTCLGCGPGTYLGIWLMFLSHILIFLSSFSLPSPLSKKWINK